jgi:DNA recombination protein RmuC
MELMVGIVIGAVVAGVAAVALVQSRRKTTGVLSTEVRRAVEELMTTGKALMDAERELASKELEGHSGVIGEQIAALSGELRRVTDLVGDFEADRAKKFGELSGALEAQRQHIAILAETTQGLRQALSSSKARGQWGERMADDVLRLHGFHEGINYRKQRAIEAGVPDFTFFLPDGLLLHMDVKFPLDNYLRYLEAESEIDQRRARDDFLRDVRNHVKILAGRGYSDAIGETVDCVLLFIPNEALYAFIHEQDRTILDEALGHKLVFCSPLTLYAVLAVVRQAVDNFRVERTSNEILSRLAAFEKQWHAFVDKMDKLDRSLGTARRDFDELTGTRRRTLERELDRIANLRQARELDEGDESGPTLALEA